MSTPHADWKVIIKWRIDSNSSPVNASFGARVIRTSMELRWLAVMRAAIQRSRLSVPPGETELANEVLTLTNGVSDMKESLKG
ncbi:hypothetical protein D3C73_1251740 [compost metagenome]